MVPPEVKMLDYISFQKEIINLQFIEKTNIEKFTHKI